MEDRVQRCRQGAERSGWVLLTWLPRDKRLINTWAADHTMTLANGRPILALDMHEHAYAMDYGAAAAKCVDSFMQGIRWDTVVSASRPTASRRDAQGAVLY